MKRGNIASVPGSQAQRRGVLDHLVVLLANQIPLNESREDVFEVFVRLGVDVVGQIELLRVNGLEPWKPLKAKEPTEGKDDFAMPKRPVARRV